MRGEGQKNGEGGALRAARARDGAHRQTISEPVGKEARVADLERGDGCRGFAAALLCKRRRYRVGGRRKRQTGGEPCERLDTELVKGFRQEMCCDDSQGSHQSYEPNRTDDACSVGWSEREPGTEPYGHQ